MKGIVGDVEILHLFLRDVDTCRIDVAIFDSRNS
jgi:hypothetical protein